MSKLARMIPVAAIAATALIASALPAGAAVTIGQTGDPTSSCGEGDPIVQATTAGPPTYAVPAGGGVITSWSEKGHPTSPGTGKLIIFRPTADPSQFVVVGKSAVETFVPGMTPSFPTRIPVLAGDLLGIRAGLNTACLLPGVAADTIRFRNDLVSDPDPMDGSTQSLSTPFMNIRIDVSAIVQPDCDNDGLGDETQDGDLSSCAPATTPPGPAPTLPSGAPATCKDKPATIVGTEGNDTRTGSQGPDVIVALGGNDTISGLGGNDVICGGSGKDTLKGGGGKDTLLGQKGKDTLKGGGGKDVCTGGKGKDTAKCEVEKSI